MMMSKIVAKKLRERHIMKVK